MSTETTVYLAMTAGEFATATSLPDHPAWMACHFSTYSTGLSNCPASLPTGSILMVNDRVPIWQHDPVRILLQLQHMQEAFSLDGIVLDFQRPGYWETEQLTGILTKELTCPVAVSEYYAGNIPCPVFLSSPPLHIPLESYLPSWEGREIWLEAVLGEETLTLNTTGANVEEVFPESDCKLPFTDEDLCCRYGFCVNEEQAVFTLRRKMDELKEFLKRANSAGISKAIGLYQQLNG